MLHFKKYTVSLPLKLLLWVYIVDSTFDLDFINILLEWSWTVKYKCKLTKQCYNELQYTNLKASKSDMIKHCTRVEILNRCHNLLNIAPVTKTNNLHNYYITLFSV